MASRSDFLLVDSKDRSSGTSNAFSISLKTALQSVRNVQLVSLAIPLTSYNIDTTNQNIYFNGLTAVITPGIYNAFDVGSAIVTAMEAVSGSTFSVDYSTITYQFTISSSATFTLDFGTNQTNTAAFILGFNNVNKAAALSQIADNASNLSLPSYFYVNISNFSNTTLSTNQDQCTFPIFTQMISGFFSYFFKNQHYDLVSKCGTTSPLQYLNISLNTRGNIPLNLNGVDWQMLLQFNYND